MSLTILPRDSQADGAFNGGEILEKRPIVMDRTSPNTRPYSNIFYWAHAWTVSQSSLIGLHPHQGFEILSFVTQGSIEHYDTQLKNWKTLETGDAQIIRSGSGISHAERLNEQTHMFQIWFDPNIYEAIKHPASYDDYPSASFPVTQKKGYTIKTYADENIGIKMASPGVVIEEVTFEVGDYVLELDESKTYSVLFMSGNFEIEAHTLGQEDFIKIENQNSFSLNVVKSGKLFLIGTPSILPYRAYASMMK